MLQVPSTFNANPTALRPLVIVLSSRTQAVLTVMTNDGIANMANEMNAPLGTLVLPVSGKTSPSQGTNSWNGSLCCCWPSPADGAAPNDSDYLAANTTGLIDRVIAAGYPVDRKRVYIYAQGGGGTAIAFRTACDHADKITAIFDYAGSGPISDDTIGGTDPACTPTQKVHFFHLHGAVDVSQEPYSGQTSSFNAGQPDHCPSAINDTRGTSTLDQLKAFNGCTGALTLTNPAWDDLVTVGVGNETDLYTQQGCSADGTVLFGSVGSEDHSFAGDAKNPNWKGRVYDYFLSKVKP